VKTELMVQMDGVTGGEEEEEQTVIFIFVILDLIISCASKGDRPWSHQHPLGPG